MILQSLNQFYERLTEDPEIEIPPYGYSSQKISFCIVINQNGKLIQFSDIRRESGNRLMAQEIQVCGGAKPPGSGLNPCFLWDNSSYLLGYKPDAPKPERTREAFEASRDYHLSLEKEINHGSYSAVCQFLKSWNPTAAADCPELAKVTTGFLIFQVSGEERYVHETPKILNWWSKQFHAQQKSQNTVSAICLVTGKKQRLARLHEPKIKGVWGAQSTGASIVSFNASAYESYHKGQSFNAPVSEQAAFQYCTALNYLLSRNNKRSFTIGDTTVVFWTERASPMEHLFSALMDPGIKAEDESLRENLNRVLKQIVKGEYPNQELGAPETPFYVLGLSPNAARISVRFWYSSSLGEIFTHLSQHIQDLEICGRPEKELAMPAIWQLLSETGRDNKDIPPLLAGSVLKAILSGQAYPQMLYSSILRRIRVDRQINHRRASLLKAYLNRQIRIQTHFQFQMECSMSLDTDYPEPAYHMGRLFSELENTQKDALPGVYTTIKDRFFGGASATPGIVFPRLIRMNQYHLGKLDPAGKAYHEKRIQEICQKLDQFPAHLGLLQQGLFALGYYHQRQDIFVNKALKKVKQKTEMV
ncbi:CRISPR-associated protein (Cas_Csd1) [Gimesia chilikensis]|uniref:CRISPR-associated protein (Cas_Csd1) n=1 Tax=Gimesia chilikensis TaxID=2605989 RepID=A0A517WK83_9PLAN|nr:type I-C CRISPR-associated protein Cas8c/Csd1 [Gimesia chilikensis]QDU05670.1 CRISPR-associated protein (Cas_Csd1) [Gimesia chilikensis]